MYVEREFESETPAAEENVIDRVVYAVENSLTSV